METNQWFKFDKLAKYSSASQLATNTSNAMRKKVLARYKASCQAADLLPSQSQCLFSLPLCSKVHMQHQAAGLLGITCEGGCKAGIWCGMRKDDSSPLPGPCSEQSKVSSTHLFHMTRAALSQNRRGLS